MTMRLPMTVGEGATRPGPGVAGLALAVQFVCLLDFMAVLPLGADLARALGFPAARAGALSLAYTAGSVLAGLVALGRLDRHARRPALVACLAGFALATFASACSNGFGGLLAARALTGLCAGPSMALAMAVLIDHTPPQARGRAIGRAMTAFPLAVVLGVPASLEAARWGDWRTPLLVLTALAATVTLLAWRVTPPGAAPADAAVSARTLLARPAVRLACALQGAAAFSTFLVVPQYSAWLLLNLGFPRDRLGLLYTAGGVGALLAVRGLGALADRIGAARAALIGSGGFVAGLAVFGAQGAGWPAWAVLPPFVALMAGNAARNVCLGAATSHVPSPRERAGFMSLQGLAQDAGMGLAAGAGCLLLGEDAAGRLTGALPLAALAGTIALLLPWWMTRLPRPA